MTLNTLLEESQFDFTGPSEVKPINRNFDTAKKLLLPNLVSKGEIQKLKTDKDFASSKRGEALLAAVNILAKVGHKIGSGYSPEKNETANEILGRLGISFPDKKSEMEANPFYEKTQKVFYDKFENQNPNVKSKRMKRNSASKEEPKPEQKPEQKIEPEEEPTTQEVEPEETEPEETEPEEVPAIATKDIPKSIQKIADDNTKLFIKSEEDFNKKGDTRNAKKIEDLKKAYDKKMEKLIRKSEAGPKNAKEALRLAKTTSELANLRSIRKTLPSTVSRGIQGAKEGLQRRMDAIKGATEKVKQKYQDNETLKKMGNVATKVSEKIKPAVEKGAEKVGSVIAKSAETKPIKTAIDKATKSVKDIAKGKEVTKKVLDTTKKYGSDIKTGTQMAAEKVKETAKKVFSKKEKKPIMPPEGVAKPSTQVELSPEEESKKKNTILRLAAKAKRREKSRAIIKKVPGVRRIS